MGLKPLRFYAARGATPNRSGVSPGRCLEGSGIPVPGEPVHISCVHAVEGMMIPAELPGERPVYQSEFHPKALW